MIPSKALVSVSKLPTKAAKIRALAEQGYPRADIARALGIRYQQARNVLEREKLRDAGSAKPPFGFEDAGAPVHLGPSKLKIGPDGRVVIPAAFREALGLKEGDLLFAHLEDGEIYLLTPKAAMRRAQTLVRRFVPEGVSLVDELLADRRREVEREERGG